MHNGKLDILPIPNINVGFSQIIESKRMNKYLDESLNDIDLIYIPNIYYWALGYAKRRRIPSVITITMPWPTCFYQNLFLSVVLVPDVYGVKVGVRLMIT